MNQQLTNIQFTKVIKAGGRLRPFNFRKSQGIRDRMFIIDVPAENSGLLYIFYRLKDDQWVLENKSLVSWIGEVLPEIETAIGEYK